MTSRRELRIVSRTQAGPFVEWAHRNLADVQVSEPLRILAELDGDPEIEAAWLEYRDVSEWRRDWGATLLTKKGRTMPASAFIKPELRDKFTELTKAGTIEVWATDPLAPVDSARHTVEVTADGPDKGAKIMTTDELNELVERLVV